MLYLLLSLAVFVQCEIALVYNSAYLRTDMCAKFDNLRAQFLKVVIAVCYFLLLFEISGLQLSQRPVYLNLEVSLQLLHMRYHSLLLTVKMRYCLLVFSFNKLDHVLSLSHHAVVFIVELFHSLDVVTPGLFGQLETLLDLLLGSFSEEEQLFLHCLYLFLQFSNCLLVGSEIELSST